MDHESVRARAKSFGSRLLTRLSTFAGHSLGSAQLHRFWLTARAGEPVDAIDARLLRDIGLSDFAADRAGTAMSSRGLAEGFSMAGLGSFHGPWGFRARDPGRSQIRIVWKGESDAP